MPVLISTHPARTYLATLGAGSQLLITTLFGSAKPELSRRDSRR